MQKNNERDVNCLPRLFIEVWYTWFFLAFKSAHVLASKNY